MHWLVWCYALCNILRSTEPDGVGGEGVGGEGFGGEGVQDRTRPSVGNALPKTRSMLLTWVRYFTMLLKPRSIYSPSPRSYYHFHSRDASIMWVFEAVSFDLLLI